MITRSTKNADLAVQLQWLVFQYFITMSTCDICNSDVEKIRRAQGDTAKRDFMAPDLINTQTAQFKTGKL